MADEITGLNIKSTAAPKKVAKTDEVKGPKPAEALKQTQSTDTVTITSKITRPTVAKKSPTSVDTMEMSEYYSGMTRTPLAPKGLHVPTGTDLPPDVVVKLESGELKFEDLPKDQQDKLVVKLDVNALIKQARDIQLGNSSKAGLDWTSQMLTDGKTFPYVVVPPNLIKGFPTGIDVKNDGQTFNPKSVKQVYFTNPYNPKEIVKGIYFETTEPKIAASKGGLFGVGAKPGGPGGNNGLIVYDDQALVIFDNPTKTAYEVNFNAGTVRPGK